jgi:flavin-dependent dehydrogenase
VSAGFLVGAGGQFCPVAAWLRAAARAPWPAEDVSTVVAREIESAWSSPERGGAPMWPHLWFSRDLDGYGWVFPKGEFVNIGVGRRSARGFAEAVDVFARLLPGAGVPGRLLDWRRWPGHAYRLRGTRRPLGGERLVLTGDAAGLAFRESGEGIGPAVESGLLAAALIARTRGEPTADDIEVYARHAGARDQFAPWPLPGILARQLLHVAPLVRLAMDRWFLRRDHQWLEAA